MSTGSMVDASVLLCAAAAWGSHRRGRVHAIASWDELPRRRAGGSARWFAVTEDTVQLVLQYQSEAKMD